MSSFLCELLSVYHLSGRSSKTRYWQIQSLGDPVQLTVAVGSKAQQGSGFCRTSSKPSCFYIISVPSVPFLEPCVTYFPFMTEYLIVIYSLDLTMCKCL